MNRPALRRLRSLGEPFVWPLVPWGGRSTSSALSVGALVAILLTRLLLLPRGPWEQDEALLASGVVDFDPASHMPLPPGFPLWIAIGKVIRGLGVVDPLLALQVASAAFSVLALWALVGLWDRLVGRPLALGGALLAGFLPGVWFHAGRGFSETPSAALAIVGFAYWVRQGRAGFAPGVVALTAAALIRPPLAPFFVVAVLIAAVFVAGDARTLARGAGAGAAVFLAVMVPAVVAAGGMSLYWDVTATHAGEHFASIWTVPVGLADLGFVRGLATLPVAGLFAILAAVGWWRLRAVSGARWWAGGLAGGWLLYVMLFMHGRAYPRYWVLVWLLMATPAVAAIRWIARSRGAALAATVAAAGAGASWAWPAMTYVHRNELPVVAALERVAQEGRNGLLVFEDPLFSYRNLAVRQGWLLAGSVRVSEIRSSRLMLGGMPFWFLSETTGLDLESNASSVLEYACWQPQVRRLSQERFLTARLVRNPVLVWRGGTFQETEGVSRYMWCPGESTVLLPPIESGGAVALAVEPHPVLGPVEVVARVAGRETFRRTLPPVRQVIRVPLPALAERNELSQVVPVDLSVNRETRFMGDMRPLAMRIFHVSLEAPPYVPPASAFLPEAESMLAVTATGEGTYAPETLGSPPRAAAWTGPSARFTFPVAAGTVGVDLIAPRPERADVEVRFASQRARLSVGNDGVEVGFPVPPEVAREGRATLELTSSTWVPGGGDTRQLGVAISRIWFVPAAPSP